MSDQVIASDRKGLRVAILGAGAAGLAAYVLLRQNGHDPVIFSPSGASTKDFLDGNELRVSGAIEASLLPKVALTMADAVAGAVAVLVTMPANGHRACFEQLAPLLSEGQTVIISAHAAFGALFLNKRLSELGTRAPIVVWARTITRSRRPEPTRLRISNFRGSDMACLPAERGEEGLKLCTELFGDRFKLRDTILQTSLSNMNPHSHLALALGNITRMERAEDWAQHDLQTPAVCNLLEGLDVERSAIASAFGLQVLSSRENYAATLGVDGPLPELAALLYRREQEKEVVTYGPKTLQSRYVLEDMPYGVTTTLALARMTGKPAPLHEAGLLLISTYYARNFATENDVLSELGLDDLNAEQFAVLCKAGYQPGATP